LGKYDRNSGNENGSKYIGLKKIYSLLERLSKENSRYIPSDLLKKEANN